MSNTYKVTTNFYDDYEARDLATGTVTNRGKLITTVELSDTAVADLLSDAEFYAASVGDFDPDFNSLCKSAAATVRRTKSTINKKGSA